MIKYNGMILGENTTFATSLEKGDINGEVLLTAYYLTDGNKIAKETVISSRSFNVISSRSFNTEEFISNLKRGFINFKGDDIDVYVDISDENWDKLKLALVEKYISDADTKVMKKTSAEIKYGFKKGEKVYVDSGVVKSKFKFFEKNGLFEAEVVAFFEKPRSDGSIDKFLGVAYDKEMIAGIGGKMKNKNLQWVSPENLKSVNTEVNLFGDAENPILSSEMLEKYNKMAEKTVNVLRSGVNKCKRYTTDPNVKQTSTMYYDESDYENYLEND